MPKYRLSSLVTVSAYTTVEAETLAEAIDLSRARGVHAGGGGVSRNDAWLVDELDGEPFEIEPDSD